MRLRCLYNIGILFWKFVIVNALKSTWFTVMIYLALPVYWSTEETNFKRHKFSADRYFHLPNLVGQKDFHIPKRNFHLPNGSLVGVFRHPVIREYNCWLIAYICSFWIPFIISQYLRNRSITMWLWKVKTISNWEVIVLYLLLFICLDAKEQ